MTVSESFFTAWDNGLRSIKCFLGCLFISMHQCQLLNFFLADDWRYRHAGLMAISAVAEGCKKQMEPLLKSIVEEVLLHLTDQVQFFLITCFSSPCLF